MSLLISMDIDSSVFKGTKKFSGIPPKKKQKQKKKKKKKNNNFIFLLSP